MVTIYPDENSRNLGNTLQHYALQEATKSLGYDTASLICPMLGFSAPARFEQRMRLAAKFMLAVLGSKKYRHMLRKKAAPSNEHIQACEMRGKIFADFYDEYIDGIIRSTYREVLGSGGKFSAGFDRVIAGSDQIWSKAIVIVSEALRFFYLMWAEKEKRVCYAPSFGDKRPLRIEFPLHRKGLGGFARLSCREKSGCGFIRELAGRDAELVLDPTLLLTAEQWREIARKPECGVPEHYVLRYCWGSDSWHDEQRELAGGREIIDVLSRGQEYYSHVGPREFIWLVDHADFVFSESFHGTAFAVNLGKNFVSFMRERKDDGRIGSLLSSAGIAGHVFGPGMKSVPDDVDYDGVRRKLDGLRAESMQYLRECLKC
ncbi:MAG: polysaccharide pyruvyl transferase family protein [Synergistaceae bacterium]|nr:polysaccharide pyruvyl transferase family protein [Synergistaceae bacterium]